MGEEEIIQLLKENKELGMKAFIDVYGNLLSYIIRGILVAKDDADDCFNEVCLKVWKNVDKVDLSKGSLKNWTVVVTRNSAYNFLKKTKRNEAHFVQLEIEKEHDNDNPENIYIEKEKLQSVMKVVQLLSQHEQHLFYRKYYYLQSNIQIAGELGISERSVEGKIYRLRKKLQKKMGDNGNE